MLEKQVVTDNARDTRSEMRLGNGKKERVILIQWRRLLRRLIIILSRSSSSVIGYMIYVIGVDYIGPPLSTHHRQCGRLCERTMTERVY